MVGQVLAKDQIRVRFPVPAPHKQKTGQSPVFLFIIEKNTELLFGL